jgi:hypothetical protein
MKALAPREYICMLRSMVFNASTKWRSHLKFKMCRDLGSTFHTRNYIILRHLSLIMAYFSTSIQSKLKTPYYIQPSLQI